MITAWVSKLSPILCPGARLYTDCQLAQECSLASIVSIASTSFKIYSLHTRPARSTASVFHKFAVFQTWHLGQGLRNQAHLQYNLILQWLQSCQKNNARILSRLSSGLTIHCTLLLLLSDNTMVKSHRCLQAKGGAAFWLSMLLILQVLQTRLPLWFVLASRDGSN